LIADELIEVHGSIASSSSLEVHPVAGLPLLTHKGGGRVVIVTQGPTPLDELAALRLDGDVVGELQGLLQALELD
jgi:NAD-dependent deacetylase